MPFDRNGRRYFPATLDAAGQIFEAGLKEYMGADAHLLNRLPFRDTVFVQHSDQLKDLTLRGCLDTKLKIGSVDTVSIPHMEVWAFLRPFDRYWEVQLRGYDCTGTRHPGAQDGFPLLPMITTPATAFQNIGPLSNARALIKLYFLWDGAPIPEGRRSIPFFKAIWDTCNNLTAIARSRSAIASAPTSISQTGVMPPLGTAAATSSTSLEAVHNSREEGLNVEIKAAQDEREKFDTIQEDEKKELCVMMKTKGEMMVDVEKINKEIRILERDVKAKRLAIHKITVDMVAKTADIQEAAFRVELYDTKISILVQKKENAIRKEPRKRSRNEQDREDEFVGHKRLRGG